MAIALLTFGAAFGLSAIVLTWIAIHGYRMYREVRVVTCPETRAPVAVRLHAARAAVTNLTGMPLTDQGSASRVQRAIDSGEVVPGRALRALRLGHRRDWPRRAQTGPDEPGPPDEDRMGRDPTRKATGNPLDALQDLLELPYGGVLSDPSSGPRGQSSVPRGCPPVRRVVGDRNANSGSLHRISAHLLAEPSIASLRI